MKPERVTQNPEANDQLLYFTSSSLLSDDSRLIFLSDRTGSPNIFMRELSTGKEQQLTHNKDGILKSYVYFDGTPYRGLSKAGISIDPASGSIYFIQGREIRKVTIDGTEVTLAQYPDGQMTAFTHVSEDGTLLCVPTTDARALDGDLQLRGQPGYNIDERIRTERLSSYLRVFDTRSGEEVICERVEQSWITHVQFAPGSRNLILYNHEWPSDCGIRRMWLFNGEKHIRLRTENNVRSRQDWTCHEMWERDGSAIIYHGGYHNGQAYIGRVLPDGTGTVEITLPQNYKRYGHFNVSTPGVLVSDGYYEEDGDRPTSGGDWISRIDMDWNHGKAGWLPLCRHSSSWASQDAHPHPIIDHTMTYAYFTSDVSGKRAIYRIRISK